MVGLGKLGLPTLAFFASRGCYATGYDQNPSLIAELQEGKVSLKEPGLLKALLENKIRFSFTGNISMAVNNSNITFVIVPTPSDASGEFSNDYIRSAAEKIGKALKVKNEWHLVVLVSTVMPGATREHFVKVLEYHSDKICGLGFGVCYSPEFIALGSVLYNLENPDFMLIGQYDDRSGKQLEEFHSKILPVAVPNRRMTLENAELAKIAVNTFVTTKISYANMLAEICEKMPYPGMDVSVITNAIGLDARIGKRYLSAGLGFGGPCFPRDNKALSVFAKKNGAGATLAEATETTNRLQAKRLVARIYDTIPPLAKAKRVAVLGLSYKKDTAVIEESQGIEILKELLDSDAFKRIEIFDAAETVSSTQKMLSTTKFREFVHPAASLAKAVKQADIVIIAVADKRFVPEWSLLKNKGNGVLIVDPWRIVEEASLPKGASYCTVGK